MAEAYWGTEGRLLELGFDFTYDKTLLDALQAGNAAAVREKISGESVLSKSYGAMSRES